MKRIAVIVRAADPDRVAEALRAAVGLGLRGDRVHVVLAAGAGAVDENAPVASGRARALATLRMLGHDVVHSDENAPDDADGSADGAAEARAVRAADAVEVWT
jgi:hypothetical protein